MIVLPSFVKEYSTAVVFDVVTRLATNPVDSRLRSVLVSMRCETNSRLRRNSPCRRGLSLSENKIFGVHLPIKSSVFFDSCVIKSMPPAKTASWRKLPITSCTGRSLGLPSPICVRARHLPRLPVLAHRAQLGTYVYLVQGMRTPLVIRMPKPEGYGPATPRMTGRSAVSPSL